MRRNRGRVFGLRNWEDGVTIAGECETVEVWFWEGQREFSFVHVKV